MGGRGVEKDTVKDPKPRLKGTVRAPHNCGRRVRLPPPPTPLTAVWTLSEANMAFSGSFFSQKFARKSDDTILVGLKIKLGVRIKKSKTP